MLRKCSVFWRADFRLLCLHVLLHRIVHQSRIDLDLQNTAHGVVDPLLRDRAFPHCFQYQFISFFILMRLHQHIDAGIDRPDQLLLKCVAADMMDRLIIAHDHPVEAHFLAENTDVFRILVHLHAVHASVREHDRLHAGIDLPLIDIEERLNLLVTERGVAAVDQVAVLSGSPGFRSVGKKVLCTGNKPVIHETFRVGLRKRLDSSRI